MQLKNIRGSLAIATCTLLSATSCKVTAQETGQPWDVDTSLLLYSEKDRVNVAKLTGSAQVEVKENTFVRVDVLVDTISGSSPNGASATDVPQTFTAPSGDTYTTAANKTPLRTFRDLRVAAYLEREQPHSRLMKGVYGANVSIEGDYLSLGGNATLSVDNSDRLVTWSAGAAVTLDTIKPRADYGVPKGLDSGNAPSSQGDSKDKMAVDLLAGVTRILTRQDLLQFNYSLGVTDGYLTDPYKILSVVDGSTGATTSYLTEKRPDSRTRQSLYLQWSHHYVEDVLYLSYRYFWDDWDVTSHTADIKYRYELDGGRYLQPHLRYYTQTAAVFYHHSLVAGEIPQHASADFRLGEFDATTVGLKYGWVTARGHDLSLRVEMMEQRGNSHPADAIGLQRSQDLFPTLEATIIQFTYSFVW